MSQPVVGRSRTATLRPEQALLLDCARRHPTAAVLEGIRSRVIAGLDWNYVMELAARHGVSALLLNSLTAAGAAAPAQLIERLSAERVRRTALNLSLTVQLRDVIDRLRSRGIPALAFKGPALAASAYGHFGARTFQDLDILVPLAALADLRKLMHEQGYRMSFREHRIFTVYPRAGKDELFRPTRPGLANIEVHVAIAEWGLAISFDANALLRRAVGINMAGGPLWTLCPEDALLVGAVQAMTHHWAELKHISEIDAMAAERLDWDVVIERARATRISRILAVGLLLARNLMDCELRESAQALGAFDRDTVTLAEEITEDFFVPVERRRRSLRKSRLRMRCREYASDRVRYAIRAPLYRLACGIIGKLSGGREAATATG